MFIYAFTTVWSFLKRKERNSEKREGDCNDSLLCRFVLDGSGNKIGESIAIDGDVLIIKSGSRYLGVPLKHVKEKDDSIVVRGLIEKDKAELLGERWRQESLKEIK